MEGWNVQSYLQRATQESARDVFILRKKRRNIKRKQMSFEMTSQGVKDKLGLM